MDKNLRDIEKMFQQAYGQHEEQPSPASWQNINARLDRSDATRYKRRSASWKKMTMLLFLLLSVLVIYESRLMFKNKLTSAPLTDLNYQALQIGQDATINNVATKDNRLTPENKNKEKENGGPPIKKQGPLTQRKSQQDSQKFHQFYARLPFEEMTHEVQQKTKRDIATESSERRYVASPFLQILPSNRLSIKLTDWFVNLLSEISHQAGVNIKTNGLLHPDTVKSLAGQKHKSSSKAFSPYWMLSVFYANEWGNYQLDNDNLDNTASGQDDKDDIDKREQHEMSYSSGIFITRLMTRHIGVKTGLVYSNNAIVIDPQEMYAAQEPGGGIAYKYITSSGYGYIKPTFGNSISLGDSIQSAIAQHNIKSLSVPLMVGYKLDHNHFSVMPSIGLSANFITRATVKTEVTNQRNREAVFIDGLKGTKRFYAGVQAELLLQYHLSRKVSIEALPSFKMALSPTTKSNVVKTYPYSYSLGAGLAIKL